MAEELIDQPVEVEVDGAEVEVEIIDDTPEAEKQTPGKPIEENLDEQSKSVRRSINRLTAQRSEALRQLGAKEREHNESVELSKKILEQLKWEQAERIKAQNAWKAEAAARRDAEIRFNKGEFVAARTAEDPAKEADINAQLARLAAEKGQIEQWAPVTSQIPVLPEAPAPQQAVAPQPTEQDKAWLKANPWFEDEENAEMVRHAVEAENALEAEGYRRGSKACYDALDANLRKAFPDKFSGSPAAAAPKKNTSPVVGAPRTNGTRSSGNGKITLNASQAALCRQLNIPYAEYAKYMKEQ